jgi:hypothetical protein
MTHQDPYAPPNAAVSELVHSGAPIRWGRILAWGGLLFAVTVTIYVVSGFLYSKYRIYGIRVDEIIVSIASFILYFSFLRTTLKRHFLQLAAVFLASFVFGLAFSVAVNLLLMAMVDQPFGDLVSFASLAWSVAVCLLAYAAWYVLARKPVA